MGLLLLVALVVVLGALSPIVYFFPRLFPRGLYTLGALIIAAFLAYFGNVFLAGSFDLYDLWGHPPRSFIEVSIVLVGIGVAAAVGGLAVLIRGQKLLLLGLGVAIGMYASQALLFGVCDAAYNDKPDAIGGPACQQGATLLSLASACELLAAFAAAMRLSHRHQQSLGDTDQADG